MNNALALLNLQSQDKVVAYKHMGYGQYDECLYYVECADPVTALVHVLSATGYSQTIRYQDIIDIQRAVDPVMVTPNEQLWTRHGCDPRYLGRPVRAISASVSQGSRFRGLVIPKWPGSKPGAVIHLDLSAHATGRTETELLAALPSAGFSPRRCGDPEKIRKSIQRTASGRITKWIQASCQAQGRVHVPKDASV